MSSGPPKDDVDRLFSCFKCGLSPPQSALKERKERIERSKIRASLSKGETSALAGPATPGSSNQGQQSSAHTEKVGMSTSMAIKLKSSNHISPVVFYGSPHGAPVKRPSKLLRLLHEIHGDLNEQNDLVPRKVWATFPRQEEAIRFARTHSQVYLFSYQDHLSGQRRFLVSTYEEFWLRYKNLDSKCRHHYEVIQEGMPCHLYYDLEFNKKVNTDKSADEMVDILISITFNALFDKYSIQGNQEWITELDSTTEEKFSRHLIIRIPRTAFKDNSHAGAFVYEVCSRIGCLRQSDPQLDKLYIRKDSSCPDSPSQLLFLDTAVYSRNRCFRLALSSKAGKNSFLFPTERFKCKNMSEKQMFMESLICRMDDDCNKLLICKMDLECKKTLCFDSEVHEQSYSVRQDVALHACENSLLNPCFTGKSPFPALDEFVESIASIGNISGRIRNWYWFSEYGLMVYSMLRSRYCERIGREHKSNHIMLIVDFRRAGYYQKCYDPDCKGYRSPLRPIPWEVIPDNMTLFNSTQTDKYREVLSFNFDLQHDGNEIEQYSCDNGEWITDSCKKDSRWWQEAMKYADCIDNMRNAPESSKLVFRKKNEKTKHAHSG